MTDDVVVQLHPGQAKPLELQELETEKSYAQQVVDELEAILRKLEGISPGELSFVTAPDRGYPSLINDYLRRVPNRLEKKRHEVTNYVMRLNQRKPWRL